MNERTWKCFLCDEYKIRGEADDARFCKKCNALVRGELADKSGVGCALALLSKLAIMVVLFVGIQLVARACISVHATAHGREEHPLDLLHCEACRVWWNTYVLKSESEPGR